MELDIRNLEESKIETIVFGNPLSDDSTTILAFQVQQGRDRGQFDMIAIRDKNAYVLIESAEHAEFLKKALDKAIALGWLK